MDQRYAEISTIFVSQSVGCDGANGLSPTESAVGAPTRTLDRALALVREMREGGILRPLSIALCDDYLLSRPLKIEGVERLTLTSYGERRSIFGGVRVDGWVRDEFRGVPCLSAEIPRGFDGEMIEMTDLFVLGKRALVTRYPKSGELKVLLTEQESIGGDPFTLSSGSSGWFRLDPKDLVGIDGIGHATINYFHYWIDEHSPINSYDPESGECVMRYRSRFSASSMYEGGHPSSVKYYLTNLPSTFGKENEWYADYDAGRVYYIPEAGVCPENIVAYTPTLDHLLDISSDDLTISGITLGVTRSSYASMMRWDPENGAYLPGDTPYGADIQSVCWAPGAVRIANCRRTRLLNLRLFGLGVHGICILEGVRDAVIEGCEICDIAAGGIKIIGGAAGSADDTITSHVTIRGNHIHHCGRVFEAGCGILAMHASHLAIEENEIHDLSYSGISLGWVWGYAESSTYGNLVRRNHIYHIGGESLSDMGGIYLLGKQSGTLVSENRIHDVSCLHYGAWGIYLDEGSSFVTVEKNVVYRAKSSCFHMHYGSHNVIRSNLFFGGNSPCIQSTRREDHHRLHFESNLLVSDGAPLYTGDGSLGEGITSGDNLIVWRADGEPIMFAAGQTCELLSSWQSERGREIGSRVVDFCPFLNERSGDFRLADGDLLSASGYRMPDSVAMPIDHIG